MLIWQIKTLDNDELSDVNLPMANCFIVITMVILHFHRAPHKFMSAY